jgi:hypothetical protein
VSIPGTFTGIGTAPRVEGATQKNPVTIRLAFDEPMTDDAPLRATGSYVPSVGGGATARTVLGVTPEPVPEPTYVDLEMSGALSTVGTYTITVGLTVSDAAGNTLDAAHRTASLTGSMASGALDHCELAKDRMLEQFKGKPNFEDLLCWLTTGFQDLEQAMIDVLAFTSLDTAYGAQLDSIGTLLDQGREDHTTDTEYLRFLRARARAVSATGHVDEALEILILLDGGHAPSAIHYTPAYPAAALFSCEVPVGRILLGVQYARILRSIKNNGVRLILEYFETDEVLFGWDDDPSAGGWEGDSPEGVWAEAVTG